MLSGPCKLEPHASRVERCDASLPAPKHTTKSKVSWGPFPRDRRIKSVGDCCDWIHGSDEPGRKTQGRSLQTYGAVRPSRPLVRQSKHCQVTFTFVLDSIPGPVVADLIGQRNPHFALFGDTVFTASRVCKVFRILCQPDRLLRRYGSSSVKTMARSFFIGPW
eukprot:scaffold1148_cov122-Amphora_coffeaeformis.AAC.2